MIIPDEDDPQKIKDPPVAVPTVRYPERAAGRRPFSPLPDYETSQALAFRDFNESQVTLYKPPPRRRFFDSRFWRAAIVSLVVYILLTLFIGVPIIIHEKEQQDSHAPPPPNGDLVWPNKNSLPYIGGSKNTSSPGPPGIIPVCNNWTSVESFDGPTSALISAATQRTVSPNGQFTFTSNASYSTDINSALGSFYVGINPDQTIRGAVLSLVMQSSASVFNQTSFCLAFAENITDLSLFVPADLAPTDRILYNLTLLFPQNAIPSEVECFSTVLPMFNQQFDSFDGNVNFNKVTIEGDVSRVAVTSLAAKRILVATSLEPITGSFQVESDLVLSTALAPIVANISLYNDPDRPFPTTLDVHTANSNLTTNVTILAPNKDRPMRPNFIANLRTFSGSLSASFVNDPESQQPALQLHAFNDLGPSNVTLDNLFEGIFQVSTKQASVSITQGNAVVSDPWGSGQPRNMVMDSSSTARSYGWIGWGKMSGGWNAYQQGEVLVETSLANVTLSFLG